MVQSLLCFSPMRPFLRLRSLFRQGLVLLGVGLLASAPAARAERFDGTVVYGGVSFSLSQSTETGRIHFRLGPSFRFAQDSLSAASTVEMEFDDEGSLTRILVSPEVAYQLSPGPIRYAPGVTITNPTRHGWVELSREDGLLPQLGGVGARDVAALLERLKHLGPNPDPETLRQAHEFWLAVTRSLEGRSELPVALARPLPTPRISPAAVTLRREPRTGFEPPPVTLGADLELKLDPDFQPPSRAIPAR